MGLCQTHVILAERLCNVNSFGAEPLYQAENRRVSELPSQGRKMKQGGTCNEVSEFYSAV